MFNCTFSLMANPEPEQPYLSYRPARGSIFKHFRSHGINSKESILLAYVAWRASTTTLFLLGSQPPNTLFKNSSTGYIDWRNRLWNRLLGSIIVYKFWLWIGIYIGTAGQTAATLGTLRSRLTADLKQRRQLHRGDSITGGWLLLKPEFVNEIWFRTTIISATTTSSQSVSTMGRQNP